MSVDPSAVLQMIAQDTQSATALKTLLLRERELLERREHDELPSIIEKKDLLLNAIAQSAMQRKNTLNALGLRADSRGWQELLSTQNQLAVAKSPWQQLQSLFEECQELNEINGKMISRSKQTLSKLLSLVRGQTAAPQLYNQTGAASSYRASHSVIEV